MCNEHVKCFEHFEVSASTFHFAFKCNCIRNKERET
jgi:hypothetical protein